MRELRAGERIDLAGAAHRLRVVAGNEALLASRVGALVVPFGPGGTLADGFAPLLGQTRELRPGLAFVAGYGLDLDFAALPAGVDRLMLVLYTIGGAASGVSLADLGSLCVEIDGERNFRIDLAGRREAALIAVEAYRRAAGWRLMANGQGFVGGIGAVAHALGIALSVPDAAAPVHGTDQIGNDRRDGRPPAGASAGGSGFAVAPRLIVTNFHVICDGARILAAGENRRGVAEVVAHDPVNDIALLRLAEDAAGVAIFRAEIDIDLGEDIIAGGFPLQGLLGSGPQISGGNVSALTGINNDSSQLQFNAPIASGSSGGPLLDTAGLVVGLVRAVLRNADHAPVAQNINFGVKAALVRSFLHAAGVTPVLSPPLPARPRAEVAKAARAWLYRLHVDY